MSKKLLLLFIAVFAVFGLASCETEAELTAITFTGVADISVDNGATFNVLDGVVALGNDEVDYSDQITLVTTSSAVNTSTGALDTLQAGVHFVRYEVRVGELVAQQSRNITVKAPVAVEGELVVNGDMASGIGGWNDPAVVYVADGATMTLSSEDGALKAEVVAGTNFFTPRFGQMNMAFETGKTYEVTFDAKSSVAKEIALQVGEIVGQDFGYYNDYLRKPEDIFYRTITTEWTTYSYKFTVQNDQVLDVDGNGENGGIIFGLGTVNGNAVNATMHFDNINIEESTPDADTAGPVFSGVAETLNLTTEDTFDPKAGVTALDAGFGDMTYAIVAEIYNSDNVKISAIDMTVAGTYTIRYIVLDPLGNVSRAETLLTVSEPAALLFIDAEEFVDGAFATTPAVLPGETQNAAYQDITEAGFWYMYDGSWSGAAATYGVTEGKFEIDVTNVAGELWHFMLKQKGIELVNNTLYTLSFTASASVERPISVSFNPGLAAEVINLTTEAKTYEISFYYTGDTLESRIEFLFGGAVGKVTLDDVMLYERVYPGLLTFTDSGEFVDGAFATTPAVLPGETQNAAYQDITEAGFWYMYDGSWSGAAATYGVTEGKFDIDVTNVAGEVWHFMLKQKGISLEKDTMYMLTFTAFASVERSILVAFNPGLTAVEVNLTTEAQTFEIPFFYTGEDVESRIEFLFGGAVGKVTLDDVVLHVVNTQPEPDLFISEYVEGSSNNKAIELYNPTGAALDLTGYVLTYYNNGATPDSGNVKAFDLTGITLGAGETFTIVTDTFAGTGTYDEVQAFADADSVVFFNGDDTLVLTKDGVVIDIVGVLGEDPWTLNGETIAWANNTYVRNSGITSGSTVWDPTEWTEYDQDDFSHLGSHTS